jgi:RND superfamily putative drug exporter
MFALLGRRIYNARWTVLVAGLLLLVAGIAYGTGVIPQLKGGGFEDKGSESYRAMQELQSTLHLDNGDIVLLFRSDAWAVADPRYAAAVQATLGRLNGQANVDRVVSFYNSGNPAFVSNDQHSTYAVVTLSGSDDQRLKRYDALKPLLTSPDLQVQAGGAVPSGEAISRQASRDLERAETITFPVTAILLLIIFGGLISASLPLAIGGLAILGAFIALRLLTNVTDISIFALNIVTMLGLGLAIDYSLFIVSRFREELPGRSVEEALVRTLATAGRTVAFSAVTVALSLAALLLFPQMFFRSMGLGGIAAVAVAMLGSLTVLPALLAVLGRRVDALSLRRILPWSAQSGSSRREQHGFWYQIAQTVMRRPAVIALTVIAVLLVLGLPFLHARFSIPDSSSLPAGTEARVVSDTIARDFPHDEGRAILLAVHTDGPALSPQNVGALYDYTTRLQSLPNVRAVESLTTLAPGLDRQAYQSLYANPNADPRLQAATASLAKGDLTAIIVFVNGDPYSAGAQQAVKAIRELPPPAGGRVLVTGASAAFSDLLQSLAAHIPAGLGLIVVTVFVLLFLAFGSLVVPAKAVLLNFLSLTATFGALVWVFQEGHLDRLLGFQAAGSIDASQPVLIFAIAFGLSMDYEVFLLSRIKERYDATGDNVAAVSSGLHRTGRIITSAAALLTLVFLAFTTSDLVFIKEVGFGMALAVFMDATVVRSLLVPATMRLMGRANWWAPAPLKRVWQSAGMGEVETVPGSAATAPAGAD